MVEEPKWVSQAKLFLQDSKIDLEAARILANNPQQSEGIKRRRLFFLQQSLEKSTKGSIVILGLFLMDLPRILVVGHYLRGKDMRKHEATLALEEKLRKIIRLRMTGESSAKSLGHDPTTKLQIQSMLDGLYDYSRSWH